MGSAIYLYCFAYANLLPQFESVGIEGEKPPFSFVYNDVAAVLSTVSTLEFCGAGAEERLCDLAWIGPRACRHQTVIFEVMRHSPALPARFGTIFYSLESLENRLRTYHLSILQFLDRMVDKEEWGIRVLWDRGKAREELFQRMISNEGAELSSSPGTRYFQEQRIRGDVERSLHGWLRTTCDTAVRGFEAIVSETYARKVLPGRMAGTNREMYCNWAVLIPRENLPMLQEHISLLNASYASSGLLFELSGPWPLYSFCPFLEKEASG